MTTNETIQLIQELASDGRLDEIPAAIKTSSKDRDWAIGLHENHVVRKIPGIILNRYLLGLPTFKDHLHSFEEINPDWSAQIIAAVKGDNLGHVVTTLLQRSNFHGGEH